LTPVLRLATVTALALLIPSSAVAQEHEGIATPALGVMDSVVRVTSKDGKTTDTKLPQFLKVDRAASVAAARALAKAGANFDELATKIAKGAGSYQPFVFYVLAQAYVERGKKDEAAFWYYAGKLRARYDGARCADVSARQAVGYLDQGYPRLAHNFAGDYDRLLATLKKVKAWDATTPYEYDHRWINLHGMQVTRDGKAPTSVDKAKWPAMHKNLHKALETVTARLETAGKEKWAAARKERIAQSKKQLDEMIRRLEASTRPDAKVLLLDLKARRALLDE